MFAEGQEVWLVANGLTPRKVIIAKVYPGWAKPYRIDFYAGNSDWFAEDELSEASPEERTQHDESLFTLLVACLGDNRPTTWCTDAESAWYHLLAELQRRWGFWAGAVWYP